MPPCSTQYYKVGIKGKWNNPGKEIVPSPTPRCSSYWIESFQVTLDYVNYICVRVDIYTYTYISSCRATSRDLLTISRHTSLSSISHTYIYIYIYAHTHTHIYIYIYINVHIHIHTYIHIYIYIYIYVYVYTHTHTHSHILTLTFFYMKFFSFNYLVF